MLVSFNGEIFDDIELEMHTDNRAFKYGDGVFETMKFANGKINFWEDHYFRLMSAMRIVRMEIPMEFSPEFLEDKIQELISAKHQEKQSCTIRLSIIRKDGGKYTPVTNEIDWLLETHVVESSTFEWVETGLKMDVFKDHYKPQGLLSNIKSINCLIYTVAGIYAKENELDDVVLVNANKHVVEAVSSNVFLMTGNKLTTPTIESGCLRGVIRKNILKIAAKNGFEVEERDFSPFEIQRADEMFLTNSVSGIRWVEYFKKKKFGFERTRELFETLNQALN
ncbi:MAG: aminotransferase class IV [Schleiferiaceae bacterium]|nr:aminotransferase class IV [Schleiferiaceae bacterium]